MNYISIIAYKYYNRGCSSSNILERIIKVPSLSLYLSNIAIKVLLFTHFQYFRYHSTPLEAVFLLMLFMKFCDERIRI